MSKGYSISESFAQPVDNALTAVQYVMSNPIPEIKRQRLAMVLRDTLIINGLAELHPFTHSASGVVANEFVEGYKLTIEYDNYLKEINNSNLRFLRPRLSLEQFIAEKQLNSPKRYYIPKSKLRGDPTHYTVRPGPQNPVTVSTGPIHVSLGSSNNRERTVFKFHNEHKAPFWSLKWREGKKPRPPKAFIIHDFKYNAAPCVNIIMDEDYMLSFHIIFIIILIKSWSEIKLIYLELLRQAKNDLNSCDFYECYFSY